MGQHADTPPAVEDVQRAPGRMGEPDLLKAGEASDQVLLDSQSGTALQVSAAIEPEPVVVSDERQEQSKRKQEQQFNDQLLNLLGGGICSADKCNAFYDLLLEMECSEEDILALSKHLSQLGNFLLQKQLGRSEKNQGE